MTNTTVIRRKPLRYINHHNTYKRAIARLFEAIGASVQQIPIIACIFLNVWGIISFAEVILNNGIQNYTYWSYNIFKMIASI